jgi:hypothetical protein
MPFGMERSLPMNEKTAAQATDSVNLLPAQVKGFNKKIGNTTYIVTSRFNGDKKRDMSSALVRLMRDEAAKGIGA